MKNLAELKKVAEEIGEPISELVTVFEDLLTEYRKPKITLKDKILISRELSKVADVLLKQDRKEKSKRLDDMENAYAEIAD